MRYFLASLAAVAWALWFGGLVGLFLFINRLFQSMQGQYREVFDVVAPAQFTMSERFAIVAAGFALVVTFGLRILTPHRAVTGLIVVLMAAASIAVAKTMLITPRMLELIKPGEAPTPEFKRLHGLSMAAGTLEALVLLIAAFFLPAVMSLATKPRGLGGLPSARVE